MPSNQTTNYGLSQWVKSDQVKMEDFNADNAKIDAAIKAEADARALQAAQIAKLGNCQIFMDTYVGTDTSGAEGPTTYTFPARPLLFFVFRPTGNYPLIAGGDLTSGVVINGSAPMHMKCEGSTVSWYGSSSNGQFNDSRSTYIVVALLAADQ